MTKRDYDAVARILAEAASDPKHLPTTAWIADRIADVYQSDNPRFSRERFLRACGIIP